MEIKKGRKRHRYESPLLVLLWWALLTHAMILFEKTLKTLMIHTFSKVVGPKSKAEKSSLLLAYSIEDGKAAPPHMENATVRQHQRGCYYITGHARIPVALDHGMWYMWTLRPNIHTHTHTKSVLKIGLP